MSLLPCLLTAVDRVTGRRRAALGIRCWMPIWSSWWLGSARTRCWQPGMTSPSASTTGRARHSAGALRPRSSSQQYLKVFFCQRRANIDPFVPGGFESGFERSSQRC